MEPAQYQRRLAQWQLRACVAVLAGMLYASQETAAAPTTAAVLAYTGVTVGCIAVVIVGWWARWMWTRWLTLPLEFSLGVGMFEICRKTNAEAPMLGIHAMIATAAVYAVVAWTGRREHSGMRTFLDRALVAACLWLVNVVFSAWWAQGARLTENWLAYPLTAVYILLLLRSINRTAARGQSCTGDELDAAHGALRVFHDLYCLYSEFAWIARAMSTSDSGRSSEGAARSRAS